MRAWDVDGTSPDEEEWETPSRRSRFRLGGDPDRRGVPVYWRARDSLYFEPLVALAIVVLMLVGLFAFTQNWPPAYVVESKSMQHGYQDQVGLINAGDLVLAEKVPLSSIVPYVVGYRDGVHTYGEPGDVLLYHPNGNTRSTPIVHRAILYLQWDPATMAYNATDLQGLPCGNGSNRTPGELYYTGAGSGQCGTTDLTGTISLYGVGWNSSAPTITLDLVDTAYGRHSGFLTLGDHNLRWDQYPTNGGTTPSLSSLVEPGWILGVARGMVPWFGAFKLLLEGNARNVSSNSWQFLGLAVVAAILSAFGIHWALRQEGIESPIRRREEEEAAEFEEERPPPSRRFLGSLRAWGKGEDEEDEEEVVPRTRRPPRRPRDRTGDPHGRPRPRVHRSNRRRSSDDDDSL
ncbi:MAG TPA: S26 family signal peptidase [Thermoplasmata archaeon]|nr:S26 family signal peptidase [Thermoplasmata archaeon]